MTKVKKIGLFSSIGVLFAVGAVLLGTLYIAPKSRENQIQQLIDAGDYEAALALLEQNGNFGESEKLANVVKAGQAFDLLDYETGIDYIYEIGGTISINYDNDGGTSSKDNEKITKSMLYIDNDADKTGYHFHGWELTDYEIVSTEYYAELDLKALYSPRTYTIEYVLDGGLITDAPTSYNTEMVVDIPNPTKVGYTFIGWTALGLEEPKVDHTIALGSVGNKVFTANWQANSYELTIDLNGGTASKHEYTFTYDATYTIEEPTRVGYDFLGLVDEGAEDFPLTGVWKEARDVSLTATWEARNDVSYVINYYLENIDGDDYELGVAADKEGTADTEITIYPKEIEGFTAEVESTEVTINADGTTVVDLYYKRNAYMLTFITNGGSAVGPVELKFEEALPSSVVTARNDFTFDGWYLDAKQTTLLTNMPAENAEAHAYYKEETKANIFEITEIEGTIEIASAENIAESIVIPQYIDNKKVTSIGERAFEDNDLIPRVALPLYIESVGAYAFSGCSSLVEITGTEYLDEIKEGTFADCVSLSVSPNLTNVEIIGEGAFKNCVSLTTINVSEKLDEIGKEAFNGCASLLVTPDLSNVSAIGDEAFANCTLLTDINNINGNSTFGENIFAACKNIARLTVEYQEKVAEFYLAKLFGEKTREELSEFYEVTVDEKEYLIPLSLVTLEINGGVVSEESAANFSSLETLTLKEGVTKIGEGAFKNNGSLAGIMIPSSVVSIGEEAFSGSTNVSSLIFADESSLASIGDYAFKDMMLVEEIVIPESVMAIGSGILAGWNSLARLSVPYVGSSAVDKANPLGYLFGYETSGSTTSKQSSGEAVYQGVSNKYYNVPRSLVEVAITLEDEIINNAFYNLDNITKVTAAAITSIGAYAFYSASSLVKFNSEEGVKILDSVTSIGEYAFSLNTSMSKLTLGEGLEEIGAYAFSNNSAITSLELPESIAEVGAYAFSGCSSLVEITGTEYLDEIKEGTFADCVSLGSVTLSPNLRKLGDYAFANTASLRTVSTFGNVPRIGDYAFSNSGLITLPSLQNVVEVGNYAFLNNELITNIDSLVNVEVIGDYAFYGWLSLLTLNLNSENTSIGRSAFGKTPLLTTATIPFAGDRDYYYYFGADEYFPTSIYRETAYGSETYISPNLVEIRLLSYNNNGHLEQFALDNLNHLLRIELADDQFTIIDEYAFSNCSSITELVIPNSVEEIYPDIIRGCSSLQSLTLPFAGWGPDDMFGGNVGFLFGNIPYENSYGALYYGDTYSREVTYYIPNSLKTLTINGGKIANSAVANFSSLEHVNFGDEVTSIGNYAFANNTSISSITIPSSVESIGEYAFSNNVSVTSLVFEEDSSLKTIGDYAFENMSFLVNIELPESLENIGIGIFSGVNSISSLKLSQTVMNSPIYTVDLGGFSVIDGGYEARNIYKTTVTLTFTIIEDGTFSFDYDMERGGKSSVSYQIYIDGTYIAGSIGDVPRTYNGTINQTVEKGMVFTIKFEHPYSASASSYIKITNIIGNATTSMSLKYLFNDVPASLKEVTIKSSTKIDDYYFNNCKHIEKITIPETVTSIGDYAFHGCISLKYLNSDVIGEFNIPKSVTSIGDHAFSDNILVTSLVFEEGTSLESIGEYAFKNMLLVDEVEIPESVMSIGPGVFEGWDSLQSLITPNAAASGAMYIVEADGFIETSTGYEAVISSEQEITTLTFTIASAGKFSVYYEYTGHSAHELIIEYNGGVIVQTIVNRKNPITRDVVPGNTLKFIHKGIHDTHYLKVSQISLVHNETTKFNIPYLFGDVPSSLKEITLSTGSVINDHTFYNCNNVEKITIPETVTSIGDYAFYGCTSLKQLNSDTDGKFNIPYSVNHIGDHAFDGGLKITKLNLSESLEVIGDYAFANNVLLTSLTIPASVISIGKHAFSDNVSIISLMFEEGSSLESIGDYAFKNMMLITEVEIPDTVITIGVGVFEGWNSLESLTTPTTETMGAGYTVKADGFIETSAGYEAVISSEKEVTTLTFTTVKAGRFSVYYEYTGHSAHELIIEYNGEVIVNQTSIDRKNPITRDVVPGNTLKFIHKGIHDTRYLKVSQINFIDDETTEFSIPYLFGDVPSSLKEVTLTTGSYIDNHTFYNCNNIEKITIPETVTSIGDYAFYGCTSLKQLNSDIDGVFNIPESVVNIGNYAFSGDILMTSITLSESLEQIGNYAFANNVSLTSLTIPASVTSIGSYAFSDNVSVTNVVFEEGSLLESIDDQAFKNMMLVTEVEIPDSVTTIGAGIFEGWDSLETLTVPFIGSFIEDKDNPVGYLFGYTTTGKTTNVQSSGDPVYQGISKRYYFVPETLVTINVTIQADIPNNAFYNLDNLLDVNLIKEPDSIGTNAFFGTTTNINYEFDPLYSVIWNGTIIGTAYESGDGTAASPYEIFSPKQYVYFINQINSGENYANTHFTISSDLRMGGFTLPMIGANDNTAFAGVLDGKGHIVSNFSVHVNGGNYAGIFGVLDGVVQNIGYEEVSVTYSGDEQEAVYVGGLAGKLTGSIMNSYVTGTLAANTKRYIYGGGLVGKNEGSITSSYAKVDVAVVSREMMAYAGGFVGYNDGTIENSIALGNVNSVGFVAPFSYASGFVGFENGGEIISSSRISAQIISAFNEIVDSHNNIAVVSTQAELLQFINNNWDETIWDIDALNYDVEFLPRLLKMGR